jgi:hypothetical protein
MNATNDKLKIYETVLSSTGMNDIIKLDLRVTRKNVLLLCRLVEPRLYNKEDKDDELIEQSS